MKNIPNILSALRIFLIPFFVWQFYIGNTFSAGIIMVISGFTDFIDGFLARKFNWITPLGKVLDPAADKLTLIAISIIFMVKLINYKVFFIIILIKDLVMLLIGGFLLYKGVKAEGAKWFGKIATVLFYSVMILIIFFQNMPENIMLILLTIMTGAEIIAALFYVPDLLRFINNDFPNNKKV